MMRWFEAHKLLEKEIAGVHYGGSQQLGWHNEADWPSVAIISELLAETNPSFLIDFKRLTLRLLKNLVFTSDLRVKEGSLETLFFITTNLLNYICCYSYR